VFLFARAINIQSPHCVKQTESRPLSIDSGAARIEPAVHGESFLSICLKCAPAYDSYYLALAETLEAEFWTADKPLFNAVGNAGPAGLHWIGEIAS